MEAAARDAVDMKVYPISEVHKLQISKAHRLQKSLIVTLVPTSNATYVQGSNVSGVRIPSTTHQTADIKMQSAISCKKTGQLAKICLSKNRNNSRIATQPGEPGKVREFDI